MYWAWSATSFRIAAILFIVESIFVTSSAIVYLKDYYMNVSKTHDEKNRSYTIHSEFIMLYLCVAWSTSIYVIVLLYFVLGLFVSIG